VASLRRNERRIAADVVRFQSELTVLLDDRPKIGKAKHRNERDQQADCAELHYGNQIPRSNFLSAEAPQLYYHQR
jgi:hypothetical protein